MMVYHLKAIYDIKYSTDDDDIHSFEMKENLQ